MCEDTQHVHYSPVSTPSGGELLNGELGDVVLVDKTTFKKVAVKQSDLNLTDYPSEQYLPVGIVVIPASHDVYGTGECGIMSLMGMNCDNPEKGSSSNEYVYWGNSKTDLSLPNLNQVPLISTARTSNEITGVQTFVYMPSTKFTSNKPSAGNGLDTLAGYHKYHTGGTIPSPYLEDGNRNPSYYCNDGRMVASAYTGTSIALSANCLSDFDGVGNTTVITAAATGQTDWKTSSTITNSYNPGYYPAACCCYRFNPDGNTAGKWYLPGMGELGYMMARFTEIQNGLTKVQSIYGSSFACLLDSSDYCWSSSECSSYSARSVDSGLGNVYCYGKGNYGCVRAFLRA